MAYRLFSADSHLEISPDRWTDRVPDVGIDKIMWGNDLPHSAGDWPNSKRVIEDIFAGVPEDEKRKILVDNAVGYFHLN